MRTLGRDDLAQAWHVLEQDPLANLFVASRVRAGGLEPLVLGCEVWGFEQDGRLTSLLHVGSNLVPVEADEQAVAAFAERLGGRRRCASIMGPAPATLGLYERLRRHVQWSAPRDVRPSQPMLVLEHEPLVAGDPRVRRIEPHEFGPYFEAAVTMYVEEVGVSPLVRNTHGYDAYVRMLIEQGRAFGIIEDGRVVFKSDIGSADGRYCQVQGVWLAPDLRGQGRSAAAMASVVTLARERYPVVSLYVNAFNTSARALYARVGFVQAREFATVLY